MPRDNDLVALAARLAYLPGRLVWRRPLRTPRKALILQPCCLSDVMLATPMLAALQATFPGASFTWAVNAWARPAAAAALAGQAGLAEVIELETIGLPGGSWGEMGPEIARLRAGGFDTCFVPDRSAVLAYAAWRAGIPQRVGLRAGGRGFAHTVAVSGSVPARGIGARHAAAVYRALARAAGAAVRPDDSVRMTFHPTDAARKVVAGRLTDELDWQGRAPLVILHPGGGDSPLGANPLVRWPVARWPIVAQHLRRRYGAEIVLVGSEADADLATAVSGLISPKPFNLAGRLSLDELGALCEVADLYLGNDAGPTHVAAAVGCRVVAIFGPTDPAVTRPFAPGDRVAVAHEASTGEFTWEGHLLPPAVIMVVDELMGRTWRRPSVSDGDES